MTNHIWKPALALGAVLAVSGLAEAGDTQTLTGGPASGTTMTLGGRGSAAKAATEDNELTRGYHGYHGYHGWGGGYGYRGYYGGYRGYYGGYYGHHYRPYYGYGYGYSFYRPYYYGGYYGYRPYYSGYYSYPIYSGYYGGGYYAPGCGFYLGISGNAATSAPAVALGNSFSFPQPAAPNDGTFPYDGGPASPVPLPQADPQATPPTSTALPISGKAKLGIAPATTPYKYKAYGEK